MNRAPGSRQAGIWLLLGLLSAAAFAEPRATSEASTPVFSDSPAATEKPTGNLPQVTVEAQRDREVKRRAHAFVTKLTHGAQFPRESIAMWHVPLCFLVGGLPRMQGESMLGRLSADAQSVGVRLAGEHCQPNFLVLLSSDPDSELQDLKTRHPRMFGDRFPLEIQRFLHPSSAQIVRIWHNAYVTNRDGVPLYEWSNGGCERYTFDSCPTNLDTFESRLYWDQLIAFTSVIIVVDKNRAKSASPQQLADYIALVGLADIDPDVDIGDAPSVLQLFKGSAEAAPDALTEWDRAFLSGLYHTDQALRSQRREVELTVARSVSH